MLVRSLGGWLSPARLFEVYYKIEDEENTSRFLFQFAYAAALKIKLCSNSKSKLNKQEFRSNHYEEYADIIKSKNRTCAVFTFYCRNKMKHSFPRNLNKGNNDDDSDAICEELSLKRPIN